MADTATLDDTVAGEAAAAAPRLADKQAADIFDEVFAVPVPEPAPFTAAAATVAFFSGIAGAAANESGCADDGRTGAGRYIGSAVSPATPLGLAATARTTPPPLTPPPPISDDDKDDDERFDKVDIAEVDEAEADGCEGCSAGCKGCCKD